MTSNNKIKILQINKLYTPPYPHGGGVEKVVQNIAEGLSDKYDVQVLACREKGFSSKETLNNVKIMKSSSIGIYWSMPLSLSFPFYLFHLSKKKDILHFHMPFPLGDLSFLGSRLVSSRSRRPKIVVTWHSDIVKQERIMRFYRGWMERFLSLADNIVVTSPNIRQESKYLYQFREKCQVIPLGIDTSKLQKTDPGILAEYDLAYEKTVLFVGRLCYYKGLEYLIRAMTDIEANLIVVGDGERREKLEQMCDDFGIKEKVIFTGPCGQVELNTWYSLCDVFLLPSVEVSEAFGLVQAEAMSFAKPVINTDLPTGVPHVSLDGVTGLTVPPRDVEKLAAAIKKLLFDEKLLQEYAGNAAQRVKDHFTLEKMLLSYDTLYRNLIQAENRPSP